MVGAFGTISFQVSNFKVITFNKFKRNIGAKFAEHEVIASAPKLEYLHRDLEEISFDMIFMKALGVNPVAEIEKIRKLCNEGTANFLVLDNKVYGDLEFVIESFSEDVLYFDGAGSPIASKISVKCKEYVR